VLERGTRLITGDLHEADDQRVSVPTPGAGCALRVGAGIAALTGTAQAAYECADLTAVTTADATITSAAIVTPPATIGGVTVTVPCAAHKASPDRRAIPRSSSRYGCTHGVRLDRPNEGQWHWRLRRLDSLCAAGTGHRRRLRHRR